MSKPISDRMTLADTLLAPGIRLSRVRRSRKGSSLSATSWSI
jgi:hypothetical protein